MAPSSVYYTSNLVWAIPVGRETTPLAKLLKPFQYKVWVYFLVTLVVVFVIVTIVKFLSRESQDFVFGKGVESPVLNMINVFLGGSLHKLPTRNFARTILMIFMVYCFIVQNSYKGGLFQFMQMTIREPEMSSTEEMIDNNFTFYTMKSSRAFLSGLPKVMERVIFVKGDALGKLFYRLDDPEFKGALLTSADHLAYRNIMASPNRYFRHAPETIITYNIVVYMYKQSCLKSQVNQMLINLVNGGLVSQWASKFIDKNYLKHPSTSKEVKLNMNNLLGAFQLLAAGLIISSVAFLIEAFVPHLKKYFMIMLRAHHIIL